MHEHIHSYRQDLVSPSSLNSSRIARLAFYCQIPDIWPYLKVVWHEDMLFVMQIMLWHSIGLFIGVD